MKPLLIILLLLFPALAQRTAAPKTVLYDFRNENTVQPAKISAAVKKSVLSKVFRRYLTDENKCNPNFQPTGDYLAAARKAGQFTPSIIDAVTGSFTATGQTQTAYLISVSECGASHADNFGTNRIAIFSGQQLIADFDADFKSSIVRKTDLNGDGIDELLMTSGYMNQGVLSEGAALVNFERGRLNVIHDFAMVNEDSCASGFPGSAVRASVISIGAATPGKMPKLQQDNYTSTCRNVKKWRFLSTGKMPD